MLRQQMPPNMSPVRFINILQFIDPHLPLETRFLFHSPSAVIALNELIAELFDQWGTISRDDGRPHESQPLLVNLITLQSIHNIEYKF